MPTVAIIPVKSFSFGKRRLAAAIDDETRAALGRALAEHVAGTVESAGLLPLVVTADGDVARWATLSGFPSLPEPGIGLDSAALAGVEWALSFDSRWIVLHSDLPLLDREDIAVLNDITKSGRDLLAPSADGGTSAIGASGVFDFSFGIASFHRHLTRLPQARIVARPGLAFDLDDPDDLAAAAQSARGRWLRAIVG